MRDLAAIRIFIAADNVEAANRQVTRVLGAADHLADYPEMGRAGRCAGTRELVVARTPYILPYRVGDDHIDILRVPHGRQRWPSVL